MTTLGFRMALLAVVLGATLSAQDGAGKYSSHGYGFYGLNRATFDTDLPLSFGAGGEGMVAGGLGVGGEIGYLYPGGQFSQGIGLASANASYHFFQQGSGRWVPFLTGGYTLGFRSGATSLVNYGGGLTYWFRPRLGLRLEVRDHHHPEASIVSFRVGISFR